MKSLLSILLAITSILVFTSALFGLQAQPSMPFNPDQAPIDGGLGLLAAAGGAYAYKKLRDRSK